MAVSFYDEFEARVRERPDSPAVRWNGTSISYRALQAQAVAIAARLREAGIGRGDLFGIATARGPAWIPAVLGAMRLGAAWVPLDPGYPAARLLHMIQDSGVKVVIVDQAGLVDIPSGVRQLHLDSAAGIVDEEHPSIALRADDLAYAMYTSGSSGGPKGVLIEHGSLLAAAVGMRDRFGVTHQDRVLHFLSMSFDACLCEVGIALAAGACVVVPPGDQRVPDDSLMEFLRSERVTVMTLPPSVVAALPDTNLPHLRALVFGGEPLPKELAARWAGGRALFNAYGPTEASITATVAELTSGASLPDKVTIGSPLPGVDVRLLGPDRAEVAAGEVGEIVIAGAGVARGYLNQPELTQRKFIRMNDGRRAYATGDLGRWAASGEIEFCGRLDQQVKLNGFRIELDEIADVLRRHPGVDDAVVVVRGNSLAAYAAGAGIEEEQLRRWCSDNLPGHMVPRQVSVLDRLPLTANGKVDRNALPEFASSSPSQQRPVEPRTPTESLVCRIMGELLGTADLGPDDNFFSHGGHSLLVGRLAARLRIATSAALSVAEIYAAPTARSMAPLIAAQAGAVRPFNPPALLPSQSSGPAPLSFPQERVWFLEQISPGNLAYQAQATLRIRGHLNVEVLSRTLTEIVRRHETFRTAFVSIDGAPMQVVRPPFSVNVPVVQLTAASEADFLAKAQETIAGAMQERMKVDEAPLVRWLLLRHTSDSHILFQMEHHLVHDGWSFAVFMEEFKVIYEAYLAGDASPLAEPSLQFSDFTHWQRHWLSGDVLQSYLSHWSAQLRDLAPPLELPVDHPRPPAFRFSGSAVREDFAPAEYRALRDAAKAHGVTLFTLMLSGFVALLARYGNERDIVVGVGSANRRLAEAERLVGMIINTLPLRVGVGDDPGFRVLLNRVHSAAVECYTWQDVPLDRLVDALPVPRDPSRNPLFSTIFSFHDVAVPDLKFGGMEATVRLEHNGSAKTDLNIVVIPRAEQRVGRVASHEDECLSIVWEYADDLFDRSTMEEMLASYHRLLAAALATPEAPLSSLAVAATHRSAPEWPLADPGQALRTARDGFARAVARYGATPALVDADGVEMSYAELEAAADAMVAGWRAAGEGAAPSMPAAGRNQATVLVACLKLGVCWTPESPAAVGDLTHSWDSLAAAANLLALVDFAPHCVIQLPDSDPLRALLPLAAGLVAGKPVHQLDRSTMDPISLHRALQGVASGTGRFSVVLPAAVANALSTANAAWWQSVDCILAFGDHPHFAAYRQRGASRVLLGIGDTARPLIVIGSDLDQQRGQRENARWRGRPVESHLAVLDQNGQRCPLAVPGRLHARRAGSDPWGSTQWRGRELAAGWFEIGDAADAGDTVVHGFRVDPGCATAVLRTHPCVLDAVVAPKAGVLYAYVVGAPGLPPEDRLKAFMAERLAAYQSPARIVLMPAIALTAEGEVDFEALPDPGPVLAPSPALGTKVQKIASMCAELLGVDAVDPERNFFLLGGRSLLATRLIARVNEHFATSVPVGHFMRQPTIRALATAVDACVAQPDGTGIAPSARRNAADLLTQLDGLSDEQVARLLSELEDGQ